MDVAEAVDRTAAKWYCVIPPVVSAYGIRRRFAHGVGKVARTRWGTCLARSPWRISMD